MPDCPKPINLRPREARRLADSGNVLVVRAMEPQPPADYAPTEIPCSRVGGTWAWDFYDPLGFLHADKPEFKAKPPFGPPGSKLWGREAWWSDRREPNVAVYDEAPEWGKYANEESPIRSTFPDGAYPTREECRAAMLPKFWSLQPAKSMPRWASRFPSLVVASVEAKRLQTIEIEEVVGSGVPAVKDGAYANQFWREETEADFEANWDRDNPKAPWASNPWCWFATITKGGDA